ncbi:MAG: hypothetical protein OXP74_03215 [Acidobacteriota bacterium]|nr:hypothetical protein [Acidobacteriota bacterium]
MPDWFSNLTADEKALVLSTVAIVFAAATFVWNQVHQIFVRRMERMTSLLSLAAWLSGRPSNLMSDELLEERNRVSAEASAIAYLGLDGRASKLAQSLFESDEEVWADFAKPLWRSCHPFKRWCRRAPDFRFRYVTKSIPTGSSFENLRPIETAWKKCIAGTASDTQRIRNNILHVSGVPASGKIETPALVFFTEGSREDDTSAVAVSVVGAGEDMRSSYRDSRSLIRSLCKHLERPDAVNSSHIADMYFVERFPNFRDAMSNSHWRASCARIVVRNQRGDDQ